MHLLCPSGAYERHLSQDKRHGQAIAAGSLPALK